MIQLSFSHKTDLLGVFYQTGFEQELNLKGRVIFPEARSKTTTVRRINTEEPIEQLLFSNIKLKVFSNTKLAKVLDTLQMHSKVKVTFNQNIYTAIERPSVKRKEKVNGLWEVEVSFPYKVDVFNELLSNQSIIIIDG